MDEVTRFPDPEKRVIETSSPRSSKSLHLDRRIPLPSSSTQKKTPQKQHKIIQQTQKDTHESVDTNQLFKVTTAKIVQKSHPFPHSPAEAHEALTRLTAEPKSKMKPPPRTHSPAEAAEALERLTKEYSPAEEALEALERLTNEQERLTEEPPPHTQRDQTTIPNKREGESQSQPASLSIQVPSPRSLREEAVPPGFISPTVSPGSPIGEFPAPPSPLSPLESPISPSFVVPPPGSPISEKPVSPPGSPISLSESPISPPLTEIAHLPIEEEQIPPHSHLEKEGWDQEIRNIDEEIRNIDEEIRNINEEIRNIDERIDTINTGNEGIVRLNTTSAELEQVKRHQSIKIAAKKEEAEQQNKALIQANKDKRSAMEKETTAQEQLKACEEEYQKALDDLEYHKLDAEIRGHEEAGTEEVINTEEEIDAALEQLKAEEEGFDALEKAVKKAQHEHAQAKEALTNAKVRVEEAENAIKFAEKACQKTREEIDSLNQEQTSSQQELANIKLQIDKLEKELESLKEERDDKLEAIATKELEREDMLKEHQR